MKILTLPLEESMGENKPYLRAFLQKRLWGLSFAEVRYASDNACGLAAQARNMALTEGN